MPEYVYNYPKEKRDKLLEAMLAPLRPETEIDEDGTKIEKAEQAQLQKEEMAVLVAGVKEKVEQRGKGREINGIMFEAGKAVEIPDGHPLTIVPPGKKISKLDAYVGSGVLVLKGKARG